MCTELPSRPVKLFTKHSPELVNVWNTLPKHLLYLACVLTQESSARPLGVILILLAACLAQAPFEGRWVKHARMPLCLSSDLSYLCGILCGLSKSSGSHFPVCGGGEAPLPYLSEEHWLVARLHIWVGSPVSLLNSLPLKSIFSRVVVTVSGPSPSPCPCRAPLFYNPHIWLLLFLKNWTNERTNCVF